MVKILFIFLFAITLVADEKYICATIVTKNNESTINECLKSVAKVADCISIYDLGSTDETMEKIGEFLTISGIRGELHQHEPQDKKSAAVTAAKMTLKNFGLPLSQTYLLMIHPDQVVTAPLPFVSSSLEDDSYMILEKSFHLACYNYKPNLIKAILPTDKIQSMIRSGGNAWTVVKKIRTLALEDQLSPSMDLKDFSEEERREIFLKKHEEYKEEKLQRNLVFFSDALKDNPDNPRYLLYLAQSHKSLKQYEEAISAFKRRIAKGGDPEEIWFSKFMVGESFEEMGLWTDALYWYLDAYQYNPNRAESLRKIATYYRLQGQNELAYIFAKHGWRIPQKEDKNLFPCPPLHDYQFDEELSVVSYYTRFKEEGYAASNDLVLRKDTPFHIKDQGYRNLLFYVQNLKGHLEPIVFPLPDIEGTDDEKYYPMNPSICKTAEGYKLIGRTVNYTQTGAKYFHTNDPSGIFRTKNFLILYDRQFNRLSQQEIIEDLPRDRRSSYIVEGLEDCRIIEMGQSTWFTCSTFDTNPTGAIQITLCEMGNSPANCPIKVESFLPLVGPDPNRHEKNWLPLIKDGELHLIYSSDPFTIYKPDLETGECAAVLQYTPEHDFSRSRGSAAPIPFDGGYLMLVHEVVQHPDYTRTYLHRFVYLDANFLIKEVSKPFVFNHLGIEYCLSMTIDWEEKQLILPIGIEDREAYLMFVDLEEVRSLLSPLPTHYPPF
jgi:tetratricopeptide (TPR) repeat protein